MRILILIILMSISVTAFGVKMRVQVPPNTLDSGGLGYSRTKRSLLNNYTPDKKYTNIVPLIYSCIGISEDGEYLATKENIINIKTDTWIKFNKNISKQDAVFSPDNKIIVTENKKYNAYSAHYIYSLYVWDVKTGKLIDIIKSKYSTSFIQFHPSGKYFLYFDRDDDFVKLYDIEKRKVTKTLDIPERGKFSPNGKFYAGVYSGRLGVWDTKNYELIRTFVTGNKKLSTITFKGDLLFYFNDSSWAKDRTINSYDFKNYKPAKIFHTEACDALNVADNKFIIEIIDIDRSIYIYDSNKKSWIFNKKIHRFAIAPKAHLLFYTDYDDYLNILFLDSMTSTKIYFKNIFGKSLIVNNKENTLFFISKKNSYKLDITPYNINIAKRVYDKIDKKDYIALYEFTQKFYYKFNVVQEAYNKIYNLIKDSNSIEVYNWFVSNLKNDKGYKWYQRNYGKGASKELTDIEEKLYKLRQAKFTKEYEKIKEQENFVLYDHYAFEHFSPKAVNLADAVAQIHKLAFEKAKDIDTISAYNTFIKAFPLAKEVEEANKRAYELEKDKYDIGFFGFIGKDEKLNKQARKIFIAIKELYDEMPKGNGLGAIDNGYYLIIDRMYRLLKNEFSDTNAYLTFLESDKLKEFKRTLKMKKEELESAWRDLKSKEEREVYPHLHLLMENILTSSYADKKMAEYYKKEKLKADEWIRKNKDNSSEKKFEELVRKKKDAFLKIHRQVIDDYKPYLEQIKEAKAIFKDENSNKNNNDNRLNSIHSNSKNSSSVSSNTQISTHSNDKNITLNITKQEEVNTTSDNNKSNVENNTTNSTNINLDKNISLTNNTKTTESNDYNNSADGIAEIETKKSSKKHDINQTKNEMDDINVSKHHSHEQNKIAKIEKISYQEKEINATKCANKYVCIDVSLKYPVNIKLKGDKAVEDFVKNVVKQNVPMFDPNSIESYYRLLRISDAGGLPPSLYYNYTMKIIAHTDKTVSLMISTDEYTGGAHNNGELKYINLSTDTFLEIKSLDEIVKSFKRKRFKKIAEHYFRLANNISKYTDLRKIGFYKNEFKLPEHFYLGKDGIHLVFDSYEVASWGANGAYKAEFVVPYSAVEDMIFLDKIFVNYEKKQKAHTNVNRTANNPETSNSLAITNPINKRVINTNRKEHLSNDKISMDIKYKVKGERVYFKVSAINSFANAKGGISVSIPGVRFKSDILQVRGRGFNSAKVYPAGSTIWNGAMQSKMRARYVLIEGWAQKWQRGEQKVLEFSVEKSLINKKSVNIRAVLVKNQQEYLLPTSGATDQQGYPVEQVTVYANNLDGSINSKNSQNADANGLYVCYDKKEITANGVKYIGCQRFRTPCNSNNKLHFGKYKNSSDAKDALNRCKSSKPKFMDSGKRASLGNGNYYIARISTRDHYNKRGNKLTKVADILQQDRANFWKYNIRDSEDTPDNYFFKKENRFKIRRMLKNGYISGDAAYQILHGTPLIKVEIKGNALYVSLVR